ncbi:acyl-CoA N-acyltransferase [Aspergillus sergii]|uniref:Acyl-CoA N-acyltransferase n=1 Tax=Aspergillus sergii TaxID=1034303 RepID=A0A5N6XKH0_9EURO|nr:acyl-CoA N-acyltransferase [Aspergillus sergii]
MTVNTTQSTSTSGPPLKLEHATLEDIPELIEVWYNAFDTPEMLAIWPNTPGVRQWWDQANRHDMLHKPREKYLKVVDTRNGRIAAYAKWSLETAEERGPRFPPWHSDMDPERNDAFIGSMEIGRARLVGGKKNFYLDMLGTHTDYRKMGAARMLIGWGCQMADQEGAFAYIDASAEGRPVYEKFGFVDRSDSASSVAGLACMVREPRN